MPRECKYILGTRDFRARKEDIFKIYSDAKSLTAMYHFNEHGCVVGQNALQKKKMLQVIHDDKIREGLRKNVEAWINKKTKY